MYLLRYLSVGLTRKIVIFAGLLLLFISCYVLYLKIYQLIQISNSLKDISLISVQIKNKFFEIKYGKATKSLFGLSEKPLRLAAFYQWNKEDPLFASYDFDFTKFRKSVVEFDIEQRKTHNLFSERDSVYPLKFLLAFSSTAELNEQFMNNPSYENADKLLQSIKKTSYLYTTEAKNLRKKIESDHYLEAVLIRKATDKNIILSDLDKIIDNGERLMGEAIMRERCLKGDRMCYRPSSNYAKPQNLKEKTQIPPQFVSAELIYKIYGDKKPLAQGPYIASSPCHAESQIVSKPEYFYLIYSNAGEFSYTVPRVSVELADNMYFELIPENTRLLYKQKLLEAGAQYSFSFSSGPYKCPYLGYFAQVLTVNKFFANNKPIIKGIVAKMNLDEDGRKVVEEAFMAEKVFFESEYPSYDNLLNLAEYYGYLYRIGISSKFLMQATKDELLRRKINIERNLLGSDDLIDFLTFFVRDQRKLLEYELKNNVVYAKDILLSPSFSGITLHMFRSYYGGLYFNHSASVWRIKDNLQYFNDNVIVRDPVSLHSHNLDYLTAREKYSDQEISGWIIPRIYQVSE